MAKRTLFAASLRTQRVNPRDLFTACPSKSRGEGRALPIGRFCFVSSKQNLRANSLEKGKITLLPFSPDLPQGFREEGEAARSFHDLSKKAKSHFCLFPPSCRKAHGWGESGAHSPRRAPKSAPLRGKPLGFPLPSEDFVSSARNKISEPSLSARAKTTLLAKRTPFAAYLRLPQER